MYATSNIMREFDKEEDEKIGGGLQMNEQIDQESAAKTN
jgi:hypothetical protein